MEIKINATLSQEVHIDPINFINTLRNIEISNNSWIIERDDKYYEVTSVRNLDIETEISEEKYKYLSALKIVEDYLKNK